MLDSVVGKSLGKYQNLELIGRGAMAEVYKAYHPALDRFIALKLLHSFLAEDKNFLERFRREAKAVAQLRHPNIVQVYDFEVIDGVYYYIVMEYIDGYTLDAKLQDLAGLHQIMSLPDAIRITVDVASALSYAHVRGMVHRDIKPSNVMVNREGHIILTDFGIAKILSDTRHTSTGTIGTPNYISPEQGLGKPADARSDIYSLGAMVFQLVTGQLPYEADAAVAVLLKHVNDPIPVASQFNPALPSRIDAIIAKAMAKNPDDRYQTADEFINHLRRMETDVSGLHAGLATRPLILPEILPDQVAAVLAMTALPAAPQPVAEVPKAINLPPYILSAGHIIQQPSDLPAVCDADWDRAVDHFAKGYITDWLRDGVKLLRAAHQHGLADELELMAVRGEAIVHTLRGSDMIQRNSGLEEFLESLGATPPQIDFTPRRLDLSAVGIGEKGQPITLTITNSGRGYLFGNVVCPLPWLAARPNRFGCAAGASSLITLEPDLSGLPAGRIQSPDSLEINSMGGDQHLPVRVDILPSVLHVNLPALNFGSLGQGEAAQAAFDISNQGQGFLIGRVRCRAPWLTASPEQFNIVAGESIRVTVHADSQSLLPGNATHDWALAIESNGGHSILSVQIRVLAPRLKVEPDQIDLGTIDLVQSWATKRAQLTVRNSGPGILTGAVLTDFDWLSIEPATFRCRSEESQQLRVTTTTLKTGDYAKSAQVVSNAGVVQVPIRLKVIFSLEPEMLRVPEGWFVRGSDQDDRHATAAEKPQRQIDLNEYWIGRYPVTNEQYAVFVDAARRKPPEHWKDGVPLEGQARHPVVNVSWWDAMAYCRWLSDLTGKSYRLPTEAQWEKAARGTDGRMYPWGNHWEHRNCNTYEGGQRHTTPVDAYSPQGDSPYGCADMVGNKLEWTADWFREDYYSRSTASDNPLGPASGAVKVLRGGSWSSDRWSARCASRNGGNQTTANPEIGFRCAIYETPQPE